MAEHYQPSGGNASEITADIEAAVREGALAPGAQLPPVRRLAAELGLAVATVAAAYRTLRQRGIIDTAGRHGTRVRSRPAMGHRGAVPLPPGTRDLLHGEPDTRLLPDLARALTRVPTTSAGYRDAGPCPAFLDHARERFAADGVEGAFTVVSGALDGIERVLAAELSAGDLVAVEDPCWANLRDLIAVLGMRAVPLPVDEDGPVPAGLERALKQGVRAVIVTSRAQNPTGGFITAARAKDLRGLLAAHPRTLLVEDDHWGELGDEPPHPLAAATRRWVFLRSASKPYGPDLRLAVVCGDDATIARLDGRMRLGTGWVSTVLQHLMVGLWEDPETERTVARARESYGARRRGLLAALAARGVEAYGRTGLNVWVPVADETSAVASLRDAGYAVAPGANYRLRSAPGIRITVSELDAGDMAPLADAVRLATRNPLAGVRPYA